MSATVYPDSLPGPTVATLTAAERRKLGGPPFESRRFQSDRLEDQQITFPVFTSAELAVFESWFRNALAFGGKWFAATWPYPQSAAGWTSVVRRFKGSLQRRAIDTGLWQISGVCEVRGRGEAPYARYLVDLDGITNAGGSSSVGISINGLNPASTYALTQPAGRRFSAWTAVVAPQYENRVMVTAAGGSTQYGNAPGSNYPSPEAARAAFPPVSLTGYSTYTFWIDDFPTTSDNSGGLSLLIK